MVIKLKFKDDTIKLDLVNTLCGIDNTLLFSNEHQLRPPLGIFNVSKSKYLSSLEKLLDEIEGSRDASRIQELHRDLVESFIATIEDVYAMFLCFFKSSEVNKTKKFYYVQLKKAIPDVVNRFNKNVKPLREIYVLINNAVKHKHARYSTLEMKSIYGKLLGYFIDSVEDGVIIPNTDIHPMYGSSSTGISYNYDIKRILIYWLRLCELADYEIKQICSVRGIQIAEPTVISSDNSKLLDLVKRIIKLKEYYFIDEYDKGVSKFEVSRSAINIQFPAPKSYAKKLFFPSNYQMSLVGSGDGVTKSWRLPYM